MALSPASCVVLSKTHSLSLSLPKCKTRRPCCRDRPGPLRAGREALLGATDRRSSPIGYASLPKLGRPAGGASPRSRDRVHQRTAQINFHCAASAADTRLPNFLSFLG